MKFVFSWLVLVGFCTLTNGLSLTDYFSDLNDGSLITWAHGVNSRDSLEEALRGEVMMLETDISMGLVGNLPIDQQIVEPIMAHPPTNVSDINFKDWLDLVINYNGTNKKGIKLDLKFDEALALTFQILKQKAAYIGFPLIINADILPGPITPTAKPVNASLFLNSCKQHFPSSIISPGWTTSAALQHSTSALNSYNWRHVLNMVLALRNANITQEVTFPVRAPFIVNSFETLTWLHNVVPNSSFTVWMGILDHINVSDLAAFRQMLPPHQVYFDLPFESHLEYLKNTANNNSIQPIESQCKNVLQEPYFSSSTCAITGSTAMIMTGACIVTFSFPISEVFAQNGFVLKGVIEFLQDLSSNKSIPDSIISISFSQKSALYIYSNGVVRIFTEKFGWHIIQEKGTAFGFEISLPDVTDSNNLDVLVKLLPHNKLDFVPNHEGPAYHKYKMQRVKGNEVKFQIITYESDAIVLRQLGALCIDEHILNAASSRFHVNFLYLFVFVSLVYRYGKPSNYV